MDIQRIIQLGGAYCDDCDQLCFSEESPSWDICRGEAKGQEVDHYCDKLICCGQPNPIDMDDCNTYCDTCYSQLYDNALFR